MYKETLSAGVPVSWNISGRHFRLVDTTGPVNIEFYRNGAEVSEAIEVEAGYSEWWPEDSRGFDKVTITSATAQTVKFATRVESRVEYDRAVGNVALQNTSPGSWLQASRVVPTVWGSGGASVSARASRTYLAVQNRTGGDVLMIIGSGGLSDSQAIVIANGELFEVSGVGCPKNEIYFRAAVAGTVTVLEGI